MDALFVPNADAFVRYIHHDGRAPALVYLTGLGIAVAGTYDRCVADPVLGAHRAVLVDVFGVGLSDAPATFSYSLEDHARTIAALLDHLGIVWAVSVGMLRLAAPHALHRTAVGLVNGTRPTMRERLLQLAVPRAVIRGEASGPNPREAELRAAGVRLSQVAGAGHGMVWENPDGFVAAVRAAVAAC